MRDNWEWRKQIGRLAIFDLIKKSRGAVLSWVWLLLKPGIMVFVFWFALSIGLRIGDDMNPPFFLWLVCGLLPWFYMQEMLSGGSDVFHRYSYLVNKIKFPLSGIPTLFNISNMFVNITLILVLLGIYFAHGMPLDSYLLQVPLILIVMFIFFNIYATLTSLLSGLSKDFANLVKAFMTPLFWVSGIFFDVSKVNIEWIQTVLLFNPVTSFVTAFRDAFYYKTWVWENPSMLGAVGIVFLVTFVVMLILYWRLHEEVPDAL
ncbi:MAG TPA: ABC transporter [Coriobacteriia bacterium]|nr:ABC transporter [Coriobacteriia bacterium]